MVAPFGTRTNRTTLEAVPVPQIDHRALIACTPVWGALITLDCRAEAVNVAMSHPPYGALACVETITVAKSRAAPSMVNRAFFNPQIIPADTPSWFS